MSSYSTPTWGYKIVSENKINFYHVLLPKVNLTKLYSYIPGVQSIRKQKDGSITITIRPSAFSLNIVDKIVSFFVREEQEFVETPIFSYEVPTRLRKELIPWALSFEGCLAVLLAHDPDIAALINTNWQFINANTGGLFLEPFTLFLYADHPKIIHPITVGNYEARKTIEQKTAHIIRKILKNMQEAQPGLEGLALLSLVEDKTKLSQKEITAIINEKSFGVKTPSLCTFFTG